MTHTAAPHQTRESLLMRAIHAIPVIGQIARDIARDVNNVFYALAIVVTILVLAVKTWGVVALSLTALGMVPVMFVTLILLTRG